MTSNFYIDTNYSSIIGNNSNYFNFEDNNKYNLGVNDYSTTSTEASPSQYYDQYSVGENKTDYSSFSKPEIIKNSYRIENENYNTNSDIINELVIDSNSDRFPKYSTKTNNIFSNFDSFNLDNYPKYTVKRTNSVTRTNKVVQQNDNIFNNLINNYQTINFSSTENNDITNILSSHTARNNHQIINSAHFPKKTLESNAKENNKNYQNIKHNLRYSVPLKMSSKFQFEEFGQKKKNIKVAEMVSNNDLEQYYHECQSKIIQDYAYCENSNYESRDYMEDQGKAVENLNNDPNKILFCIFDGHGGGEVSKFLQENFHIYMKKLLPFKNHFLDFAKLFKFLDEKIKLLNSEDVGSTATIVYIEKQNGKRTLFCANVGDSRCVLVNRKGIMRMSHEDRVDDPQEKGRILRQGGKIANGRLNGILMLTRCFGDWGIKDKGLIVEPHITKIELNDDDLFLIIASDGLWDVIKDEECKGFMEIYQNTFDTCKNLVQESLNRGSGDNISCFVIKLN